jgi:hypothetical protein
MREASAFEGAMHGFAVLLLNSPPYHSKVMLPARLILFDALLVGSTMHWISVRRLLIAALFVPTLIGRAEALFVRILQYLSVIT